MVFLIQALYHLNYMSLSLQIVPRKPSDSLPKTYLTDLHLECKKCKNSVELEYTPDLGHLRVKNKTR